MNQFIIKDIRINKKIKLKQLSETTGISVSYLSKIENNKVKDPNFKVIALIAEALGVKVKDLFLDSSNLEDLRMDLYKSIKDYGFDDERTRKISSQIDEFSIKIMSDNKK